MIGYATFYMAPFFPAMWILRRLQARRPPSSFVWRHPLVSLSLLIYAIGFVFDTMLEMFLIRTQLYIYSQVVPFGSFVAGRWYQFPLIWEASLVTLVMIPAGVLLYRDDTGRTQAEKLGSASVGSAPARHSGTFVVMFAIINVAYFCYGGGYAIIRDTKVPRRLHAHGPSPKRRSTTPTGSTRPTVSRGHIRRHLVGLGERTAQRETEQFPNAANRCDAPMGRPECRRHGGVTGPRSSDRRAPVPNGLDGGGRHAVTRTRTGATANADRLRHR